MRAALPRRFAWVMVVAALAALGLYILWDFLPALAWAAVLAIATWPLYMRFLAACPPGARPVLAPLAATMAIGLVFVGPLGAAAVELGHEARAALEGIRAAQRTGFAVPDWVGRLPGVGERAAEWWQTNLSDPGAAADLLGRVNKTMLGDFAGVLAVRLLHGFIVLTFTLLTLFFIYRSGADLSRRLLFMGDRLLGERWERLAFAAIAAVRGAVNGLVLVGLGEGVLLGVAYGVAGVPHPALIGALTAILGMVPFGAPAVFGLASLGLLVQGSAAAAIGVFSFGAILIFVADHLVRPVLIGGAARLPFLWVLLGILGGLQAFGLLGLFLGPAVMATLISLWRDWTDDVPLPPAAAS